MFDVCHGCRRCFNLCDSFPKLFDLIDESEHEDVEHLASADFKPVTDACTLCDMCFMDKRLAETDLDRTSYGHAAISGETVREELAADFQ